MGRPKGSKNKPKVKVEEEKKKPFAWNETIQEMQKKNEDVIEPFEDDLREGIKEEYKETIQEGKGNTKPANGKKDKNKLYCDRCGIEVLDSLNQVNLTYLTGKAPWFRRVKNDKPKLCHKCCKELNDLIDEWLISGGCEEKWK